MDITKKCKGCKQEYDKSIELPLLWPNGKPLSTAKLNDLKELLQLVPPDAKHFYTFLDNAESHEFDDDVEGFGPAIDFQFEEIEENMTD